MRTSYVGHRGLPPEHDFATILTISVRTAGRRPDWLSLSHALQYSALEVAGLRDSQDFRMVGCLPPPLLDTHLSPGVGGRGAQGGLEELPREVVGGGAGQEYAAGDQQLHRAEVDLLVCPPRPRKIPPRLGEGRGIQDDHVVALPGVGALAQQVEGSGPGEGDVGQAVELRVAARRLERGAARVYDLDLCGVVSGVQGKPAGVGEDVEGPARGIHSGGEVVLALVQEAARLLPAPQVRLVVHRAFANDDGLGDLTREGPHPGVETLVLPGGRVAAQEYPDGREQLAERPHHPLEPSLDGCGAYLENEVIAVAVHHEAGHAIGLGVEDAVGVTVYLERGAVGEGVLDLVPEPVLVNGLVASFS